MTHPHRGTSGGSGDGSADLVDLRPRWAPGKCARPYRVIALRKNLTKSRGEQAQTPKAMAGRCS
jgi:hypothetical protein